MRRLVVEADVDEVAKFLGEESTLSRIESLEILNFLRQDSHELAAVCKVKFKDEAATLEDYPFRPREVTQLLERGKDGSTTFFYKGRPTTPRGIRGFWRTSGGYFATPYEIKDGKVKVTFLGSAREVRGFLIELRKLAIRYRIDSLTDARFSLESPLTRLTEKQHRVVATGFKLGYYDVPRKISSDELARILGIANPTMVLHSRRGVRRILANALEGS